MSDDDDLRRRWDAIRADPALEAYDALIGDLFAALAARSGSGPGTCVTCGSLSHKWEHSAETGWPSRDELRRMTPEQVNEYLASIGVTTRVRSEPRAEGLREGLTPDELSLIRQRLNRLHDAGLELGPGDVLDARWLATLEEARAETEAMARVVRSLVLAATPPAPALDVERDPELEERARIRAAIEAVRDDPALDGVMGLGWDAILAIVDDDKRYAVNAVLAPEQPE